MCLFWPLETVCNKSAVGLCLISVTKPEDRKGNGCGSSCAVPHEACIAVFFTVTASGCDKMFWQIMASEWFWLLLCHLRIRTKFIQYFLITITVVIDYMNIIENSVKFNPIKKDNMSWLKMSSFTCKNILSVRCPLDLFPSPTEWQYSDRKWIKRKKFT